MKERPILFSGPMVNAILDGRKTMTRRIVKFDDAGRVRLGKRCWHRDDPDAVRGCQYGLPGDRLWVRETFSDDWKPDIAYRADGGLDADRFDAGVRWRPSIHMPRSASRITLEIADVRIERLQDISDDDAKAEGVSIPVSHTGRGLINVNKLLTGGEFTQAPKHWDDWTAVDIRRHAFASLWVDINGAGSWAFNPIVWVVSFKRVEAKR